MIYLEKGARGNKFWKACSAINFWPTRILAAIRPNETGTLQGQSKAIDLTGNALSESDNLRCFPAFPLFRPPAPRCKWCGINRDDRPCPRGVDRNRNKTESWIGNRERSNLVKTKPGLGILSGMLMPDICSSQRDLLPGCLPPLAPSPSGRWGVGGFVRNGHVITWKTLKSESTFKPIFARRQPSAKRRAK